MKAKETGITIITLAITIIVLLILAGITLSLTLGQDGIITKAQRAKQEMKLGQIKETMKLDILHAETEAIIRGENLEEKQLHDIIAKYGSLQEDGDTIITHEDEFKISLKEIWYGVLSSSGSYGDKQEQIEILEKELEELNKKYEELAKLNHGNAEILEELRNQISKLEEEKKALEVSLEEEKRNNETLNTQLGNLRSEKEALEQEKTRLQEALLKLNEEYEAFKKTPGTATAEDIVLGKTAWVNGNKVTGTIVNQGRIDQTLKPGESYHLPEGYITGGTITVSNQANITSSKYTFTSAPGKEFPSKNISQPGKNIIGYGIKTISLDGSSVAHQQTHPMQISIGTRNFDGTNLTGFCYMQSVLSGNAAYGSIEVEVWYQD